MLLTGGPGSLVEESAWERGECSLGHLGCESAVGVRLGAARSAHPGTAREICPFVAEPLSPSAPQL